MINKKYIVYLGSSGFPHGLAEIQKMILISKSLIATGNSISVISKKGILNKKNYPDLKSSGNYENIDFVYTSGSPFRDESFIKRNLLKVKGFINEFSLLRKRRRDRKLDYAILSTHNFYSILYYVFVSKLLGFKTILNYVEYFSGIKKRWTKSGAWLNDKLYDKYAPKLVDGIFPISEFLIDHMKKVSPNKKFLKIPVLTDFERYNDIGLLNGDKYFLFCGAANYKEVVRFIINAFTQLNNRTVFLYLVINGHEADILEIKKYINDCSQKNKIKLFSKLTDKELNTCYKNAIALLIPLRPTLQDSARFPHKIGEYLASGNPVISTNYGEVKHYFKNMENMLIADRYDLNLFSEKMQFVINNPDVAKDIGIKGRTMALPMFDYKVQAAAINNFLDTGFNRTKK